MTPPGDFSCPPHSAPLEALDTPSLLLDLDRLDGNLSRYVSACRTASKDLRVHFKSLKCGSLARYLCNKGVSAFLCAKLNKAEILVEAGLRDVFIANEIIGPGKLARLARTAKIRVCVHGASNVRDMAGNGPQSTPR